MGITWTEFWDMTPAVIEAYKAGYKLKKEEQNVFAYLQGVYVRDALASTVGNMFKKKGAKATEYPSEPYKLYDNQTTGNHGESDGGMSEEEKRKKTEALFGMLRLMQANFEISKQAGNTRGDE